MSENEVIAKYSFLPWLRQGIANNIKANPAAKAHRASVAVSLDIETDTKLTAQIKDIQVELVGPGDIVGISRDAIVRTDPRDWMTDFEPNYLAQIEFYDEDFPWRYSPMPADANKHRLTPWITLVVLKEDEFKESKALKGPLSSFTTTKAANEVFPPAGQLWAWAHVHIDLDLKDGGGSKKLSDAQAINRLEGLLDKNADIGHSRLLCPRKLEPNTGYHAFVIPTFEAGRMAGLGQKIKSNVGALTIAWAGAAKEFPYYYRWYFRTSVRGDFEYLVRLLKPRSVDVRVGIRDMDVSDPGGGIDGIEIGSANTQVMGMEGALRSPQTKSTKWPESYPEKFQTQLAGFVNKATEYQEANPSSDPVITPPLYARWHALRQKLSLDKDTAANPYDRQAKWLTELNLDPRHRAAAGLGTRVIQEKQEEYMNKAWRQVGDVLEANRRLRIAQMAELASSALYAKDLMPLHENVQIALTQPVHTRIRASEETVYRKVQVSRLPAATLRPEFRKVVRPRGALMKRMNGDGDLRPQSDLLARINNGEITATPPKISPGGATSLATVAKRLMPKGVPDWLGNLLRWKWFRWLPLVLGLLLLVLLFVAGLGVIGTVVIGALSLGFATLTLLLNRFGKNIDAGDTVREENLTPKAVEALPKSPDFRITEPGQAVTFRTGGKDSVEAQRFKRALKDLCTVFEAIPATAPPKQPLALTGETGVTASVMKAIDPAVSIRQRVFSTVILPMVIKVRIADRIVPVMAYPEFAEPMYEPLRDLSTELLIPNINLVPQNTISLLVTNQKFIESYMVGLNHEMGRELLWREYPTDQRGSYFRQFWDVRGIVPKDSSLTDKQLAAKLKDIPEIHKWLSITELGTHNQRETGGDKTQLVLLIRGDLLKRFPDAVIYAHRAQWEKDENNNPLKDKPRKLAPTGSEKERKDNERYPLYSAKVEPDIFFLGFDITVDEARGETQQGPDDPGWFFVFKERPGEPRFGLDIKDRDVSVPLKDWDDMTWGDIKSDLTAGNYIQLPAKKLQVTKQKNVAWSAASNAADVAYIMYQDPFLAAVHAQEMLKK